MSDPIFVLAAGNSSVVLLDANSGQPLSPSSLSTPSFNSGSSIQYGSPELNSFACTGDDRLLSFFKISDTFEIDRVASFCGHADSTRGICSIPSSSCIATGSLDTNVCIWNIRDFSSDEILSESSLMLTEPKSPVWSLDHIASFPTRIHAAAEESTFVWDFPRECLLHEVASPTFASARSRVLAHHTGLGILFVGEGEATTVRALDARSAYETICTIQPVTSLMRRLRGCSRDGSLGSFGSVESLTCLDETRFELVVPVSQSGEVFVYDLRNLRSEVMMRKSRCVSSFRVFPEEENSSSGGRILGCCGCGGLKDSGFVTSGTDGVVRCWRKKNVGEVEDGAEWTLDWEFSDSGGGKKDSPVVFRSLCPLVLNLPTVRCCVSSQVGLVEESSDDNLDDDLSFEGVGTGSGGEILSLHVGHAGTQIGVTCWEMYCLEHSVQPDGAIGDASLMDEYAKRFFCEKRDGHVFPRALFLDLDPTDSVDTVDWSPFRQLFLPEQFLSGNESGASRFSRGWLLGKELLPTVKNRIRKLAEKCESLQGFVVFNGFGGTGSGFGSLLLENLRANYRKQQKMTVPIYPSPCLSTSVVEPYNSLLATHQLIENADISVVFENEAVFDLVRRNLRVPRPTFPSVNRLIAHVVSAVTSTLRFDSPLNSTLEEFESNLVPYPRLGFILGSYSPILSAEMAFHEQLSLHSISKTAFEPFSMMAKCDPRQGMYLACCLLYQGDVVPKDVNSFISHLKTLQTVRFADWTPTGMKCGILYRSPTVFPGADIAKVQRAVLALSNTTAIAQLFARIRQNVDLLFSKRAFFHWFQRDGMEEADFVTAREDIVDLERDYEEVSGEWTDEEGEEGEEGESDDSVETEF